MALPPPAVVPAQLGFLAIFNPSLGNSASGDDDVVKDQIVYYASVSTQSSSLQQQGRKQQPQAPQQRRSANRPTDSVSQEERNERLRQIGLAQGMVEFSRGFSSGQPVDTIETEKTRVILHELEPGWWILASIDLTKLALPAKSGATAAANSTAGQGSSSTKADEKQLEYSSREVKPAALLLQDLVRAHAVFLLHHDSSLSSLFVRTKRARFMSALGRYWDLFLATWNVLLHGNPARNMFGGIRIAACGELGMGVGEEERGSGEREVLEGLVERTEGLVDLVVSKFGDGVDDPETPSDEHALAGWLGRGRDPGSEDGVIFAGVGALSKHSLRDVAYWMEDLYTWGDHAYGVLDNSKATRPSARTKKSSSEAVPKQPKEPEMRLPPPVTGGLGAAQPGANSSKKHRPSITSKHQRTGSTSKPPADPHDPDSGGADKFVSYLKLGYGTYWTIGGSSSESGDAKKQQEHEETRRASHAAGLNGGHYLIGLMGDVEETGGSDPEDRFADQVGDPEQNSRTLLRTVTVELESEGRARPESQVTRDLGSPDKDVSDAGSSKAASARGTAIEPAAGAFDSQDRNKTKKLRVVVYVNQPFIFTYLFELRTDSLAWDTLYRSLHYQLAPLRRPLLQSTAFRPEKPDGGSGSGNQASSSAAAAAGAGVYDLVWDPRALTVHSTIPNIPEATAGDDGGSSGSGSIWSRLDALNTHVQILNTYAATRTDVSELERTCKTSRGWWVVWSRILEREAPPTQSPLPPAGSPGDGGGGTGPTSSSTTAVMDDDDNEDDEITPTQDRFFVKKEIFLVRRAGDHHGGGVRGARAGASSYAAGGYWTDGASRLAQGIGVDTRRYIEGLINLNR